MFSPNFAVQPYGHVNVTQPALGQQQPRAQPTRAAPANNAPIAPIAPMYNPAMLHNASSGNNGTNSLWPPVQPHNDFNNMYLLPPQSTFIPQSFESPQRQQLRNLVNASQTLRGVVDSEEPRYPPHETSSPLPAAALAANLGYGLFPPTLDQHEYIAPTLPSSPPSARTSPVVPASRMVDTPRKRGRPRTNQIDTPAISTPPRRQSARPAAQNEPMNIDSSPPQPVHHDYDSDDGADGEADDDYFDAAAYTVANGIAQKTPKVSPSKIKLKINVPKPQGRQTKERLKARGRPKGSLSKPKKGDPAAKPAKPKPGPSARARLKEEQTQKEILESMPASIKDKKQPTSVDDLFTLIAFENANYNRDPQRQAEIKEVNDGIKRQNAELDKKVRKIRERMENEQAPRRNGERNAKRGRDEEASGAESVVSVGKPRTKAQKRKKSQVEVAAIVVVPYEAANTPDTAQVPASPAGNGAAMSIAEREEHTESDHDSALSNEGLAPHDDFSNTIETTTLPPLRRLEPAPGSFIFDNAGNALPNPAYRRGKPLPHCPDVATPEKPKQIHRLGEKDLERLERTPRRQAVVFVPKSMKYLIKRIEGAGRSLGVRGQQGMVDDDEDVAPGNEQAVAEEIEDVVMAEAEDHEETCHEDEMDRK